MRTRAFSIAGAPTYVTWLAGLAVPRLGTLSKSSGCLTQLGKHIGTRRVAHTSRHMVSRSILAPSLIHDRPGNYKKVRNTSLLLLSSLSSSFSIFRFYRPFRSVPWNYKLCNERFYRRGMSSSRITNHASRHRPLGLLGVEGFEWGERERERERRERSSHCWFRQERIG